MSNLSKLKSRFRWIVPVVSLCAMSAGATVPKPLDFRIAMNMALNGPISKDTADPDARRKGKYLDYLAALGFTHVMYGLGDFNAYGDPHRFFARRPDSGWRYNGGDYRSGPLASAFSAMKAAVESRGMKLIPFVESLSHVHYLIALDSSISEFSDWNSFCAEKKIPCGYGHNHVAAIGLSAGSSANPGADQFFRETLRIIMANWGATALGGKSPEAIHIGHDEWGDYLRDDKGRLLGPICFVKADKTSRRPESRSRLVAEEVNNRAAEIGNVFGPKTKVILYGDSFLPCDNGEAFGTAGRSALDSAGALWLLEKKYHRAKDLIIMPWAYSTLEGESFPSPDIKVDRGKQLDYLERLGYRYIPGTGEDGGAADYNPLEERSKTCLFQWFRAAQNHPKGLVGYAHLTFDDFEKCAGRDGACVGYTAPLLAYLAWTYADPAEVFTQREYSDDVFAKVDYRKSVRERKWTPFIHYSKPDAPPWWRQWLR